jgi:hypothetical protein
MVSICSYEAIEDLTRRSIVQGDPFVLWLLIKQYPYSQSFPGGYGEYRGLPWLS